MVAAVAPSFELTREDLDFYHREGYLIARQLWTPEEIATCKRVFDEMGEKGEPVRASWPNAPELEMAWAPNLASNDPLQRYPRVMMPHYFSDVAMRMLLDGRVRRVLRALLDDEPLATQSMYYFKPPGGKGQALHQDNYYLRVKPDTCIAAWTAIDRSYPENGGLWVVPGTHEYEVQCPTLADPEESFTTHYVPPPNGLKPVPATLEPGDVLFFNGSVVHGSRANRSPRGDWRRSFICHYMPARATQISGWYGVFDFDGNIVSKERTPDGGPCGTAFGENGTFPFDWKKAFALGLQPAKGGSIPG